MSFTTPSLFLECHASLKPGPDPWSWEALMQSIVVVPGAFDPSTILYVPARGEIRHWDWSKLFEDRKTAYVPSLSTIGLTATP